MLPFKRILFPVDYSEPCRAVVPYVKEMARHFSAEVTLVHAYPPVLFGYGDLAVDPLLPEEIRQFETRRLNTFAQEAFAGMQVGTILQTGEAGAVIDEVVRHQGTDVVMLGTNGYGPIRRMLLGSVTTKVLHDVSAAVWTAAGAAVEGHEPALPYMSVLCALDESDEAEVVLKAAAAFASACGAKLSIVHVLEIPRAPMDFDFSVYRKELTDDADFKLRELKGRLGIDVPHVVVDAMIAEGIRDEAVRRGADLIITGRGRSQGTFSRMWSRLYPVIRESPCPVLSI